MNDWIKSTLNTFSNMAVQIFLVLCWLLIFALLSFGAEALIKEVFGPFDENYSKAILIGCLIFGALMSNRVIVWLRRYIDEIRT